ncbi:hypothetical protein MBLNU459_g0514t1 [Dothideomycetes sp. NU459]
MDRSLDEIINSRDAPRGERRGRGPRNDNYSRGPRRDERAPRRDDFPRDGVKKSYPRETPRDIDKSVTVPVRVAMRELTLSSDWVHDKFDDDDTRRPQRGPRNDRHSRYSPEPAREAAESKTVRAENLHYELSQKDLSDLFGRIGPLQSVRILYDRSDRSQGIAFVTYDYAEDAAVAVREYNGANAMGQPIRLSLSYGSSSKPTRNPFDNVEKPSRSLFDRIGRDSVGNEPRSRGGRRGRSASPSSRPSRQGELDRYVPAGRERRASRSPIRRRGAPREVGRRPGARREDNGGRGGRRGGRGDGEGRATVQGRPKKTAEELDAEMDNYWGATGATATDTQTDTSRQPQVETIPHGQNNTMAATSTVNADDDIDLMVE